MSSRAFAALVAAMALGAFGLYGATADLVPLLTSQGLGSEIAALALGLVGVGQVCGRLAYASLSRRTSAPARTCLVLAAAAVAVALLALTSPAPVGALVAAVFAGAARGNFTLLQATAVGDRWGTSQLASLNGVFVAPLTIPAALAPGGGALLMDCLGTPPAAFYVLAAVTALGAIVAPRTSSTSGST